MYKTLRRYFTYVQIIIIRNLTGEMVNLIGRPNLKSKTSDETDYHYTGGVESIVMTNTP